jgi:molecular chaperone GrpE (heat shock protein)
MSEEARPPDGDTTTEPAGPEQPDRVEELLEAIRAELVTSRERAAARERVIDRLHDDNQRLRAGERQLVIAPLLTDLQRLRNDLLHQGSALPAQLPAEKVTELLESFAYTVELTLDRFGVRVVRPEVGDLFDLHRHRAAGVEPAERPELDNTVAAVLEDGYHDDIAGRSLRPAVVRVLRWAATGTPEAAARPSSSS